MNKSRPEGIRDYDEPAGGWGATKALAIALGRQRIVAQGVVTLLKNNQPDGFDCPGCAWPDPKHTSSFEFCENGAKAVTWESTAKRVGPDFFARHTVSWLWRQSDHWLENQGRITHPLRYNAATDQYEPVDWETVWADVGARLNALPGPDSAEFYTSGRASNEAAFLFQLFARHFGTNNFPDCSNMCHEATSVGLPQSIGVGKATVTLGDMDHAELIFCIGHNPGTNHPRMMTALRAASRRGATIIVMNPFKERALQRFEAPQEPLEMATMTSTSIASLYVQVKMGGDAAALKGIAKALVELDRRLCAQALPSVLDHQFIAAHTAGFDPWIEELDATVWEEIERASGLDRAVLRTVAEHYSRSNATIACYGMGLTQHHVGTSNVQQLVNLLMLRGNIGKAGAGMFPLRGHSNVQGNRTVGITERPSAAFLDRLQAVFGFDPPRKNGHSVVEAISSMLEGRSKALICLGGNLSMAAGDTFRTFSAFRKLELGVHLATKLNRTHLLVGNGVRYVLPVVGRTEEDMQASGKQCITVEDSTSMVHASTGFLKPPSHHVRSEPFIIAQLAKATLGARSVVDWDVLTSDYGLIRDRIEAVYPEFEAFNARIRQPGGFQLFNAAQQRIWNTPTGRANFKIFQGVANDVVANDASVLRLATMRSHDQYNTTIYGLDDRYRGVFGRRDVLFINARELTRLGLIEGDLVDVATALDYARDFRVVRGLMVVEYEIPDGCCAGYYPETQPLVPLELVDPHCLTPSYKSLPVSISRHDSKATTDLIVGRDGVFGCGATPQESAIG